MTRVRKRAYHKAIDHKKETLRANQPNKENVPGCLYINGKLINPSDIAIIKKDGTIILKFIPNKYMTKQEYEFYQRGWEGKYNEKV
jgi:hypothetical protein